jgi:demethoxyubiquinone hydroxylase (CLK1/Coq7/Cat5 family)
MINPAMRTMTQSRKAVRALFRSDLNAVLKDGGIPRFIRSFSYFPHTGSPESDNAQRRQLLESALRVDLLAQEAAAALAAGQAFAGPRRPDYAAAYEREITDLRKCQASVAHAQIRPSLLGPAVKVAFGALGVVSAVAPSSLSKAMSAGLYDALIDTYNEQLREIREAGIAEEYPELRQLLRELRDRDRSVEGEPKVPDLLSLKQRWEERNLSAAEGMAALVKLGSKALFFTAEKM